MTLVADIGAVIDRFPVLITQHMPPTFTTILAEHLARFLEGQLGWLGKEVPARHGDPVGERARVALGQQRAPGVERLVAVPVGVGDDGVDEHLVSVLVESGGVAAQDHRQPVLGETDTAE